MASFPRRSACYYVGNPVPKSAGYTAGLSDAWEVNEEVDTRMLFPLPPPHVVHKHNTSLE